MRRGGLLTALALAEGLVLLGTVSSVWADDVDGDRVDDVLDVCDNTPAGTRVDAEGRPLGDMDQDCDTDLADYALLHEGYTGPQTPIFIATVQVGNPGNPDDSTGYGGVEYVYDIGQCEVTAQQYTEFLNAVAGVDTYGLYNTAMVQQFGCWVERFAGSGTEEDPYRYRVTSEWAKRPVNRVSWGDAARFANWLHNGRPTGPQGLDTTEDGSYVLNGAMSTEELAAVTREADATWVIPSEDEWYKAAYHRNDGVTGNYYYLPVANGITSNELLVPDPGTQATYLDYDFTYTVGFTFGRSEVGAHENSLSFYGTYDQGGNVWEWNEASEQGVARGLRGGSYDYYRSYLDCSSRWLNFATNEAQFIGFRVARIPR